MVAVYVSDRFVKNECKILYKVSILCTLNGSQLLEIYVEMTNMILVDNIIHKDLISRTKCSSGMLNSAL